MNGAIFGGLRQVGVGGVIINEGRSVMFAFFRILPGCFAPAEVEVLALRDALKRIHQLQLNNTTLEMDCKEVVDACQSVKADFSKFGCLIKECKTLLSLGENLKLCFIRKQANCVKHALARAAPFYASPSVWLEAPTVLVDCNTTNYTITVL